MKKIIVMGAILLAVAACSGGNGKSDLIKACVKEGEDKEMCTCVADSLEKKLDKDTFKLIAKAAKNENAKTDELDALPLDEKMAVGAAMMSAGINCAK